MELESLRIYKISMEFGEKVWDIVHEWNYLAVDTVGRQLIRSSDSIAANISEGFGRYHNKEIKHFCYVSRGSLFESKTWITKAYNRKLITLTLYNELSHNLKDLGIKLNNYINSLGKNLPDQVKEDEVPYSLSNDEFLKIYNDL
jgi:four helix bundle protein